MATNFPLVSIITVNYNQADVSCALLESLNKITYPNIEVIVIDNASPPDDDPSSIKEKYPNVVFIQNPINYGFAAGNNFGLMRARGDYVLLLNNDIEVDAGFFRATGKQAAKQSGNWRCKSQNKILLSARHLTICWLHAF